MKVYKYALAAGMSSLVALAVSTPSAFAVPPTVETSTLHFDFGVIGSCPGFDVTATFDPTRRDTTFYNSAGTPIRIERHVEVPGRVTNSVTGTSLPTTGLRNITFDLVTGDIKSTATNVHIIVHDEGTVELHAGQFVIDSDGNLVKEVGRQDPDVTPALCDALAST